MNVRGQKLEGGNTAKLCRNVAAAGVATEDNKLEHRLAFVEVYITDLRPIDGERSGRVKNHCADFMVIVGGANAQDHLPAECYGLIWPSVVAGQVNLDVSPSFCNYRIPSEP